MNKFTNSSLFFILALILDFLIISNYLGITIKYYYLKLINKSYITIHLWLFTLIFLLLTLLGYFDITLFKWIWIIFILRR